MSVSRNNRVVEGIVPRSELEARRPNDQIVDFLKAADDNRFSEVCDIYLQGLTFDDIKYLSAPDLINLVPEKQYQHKLYMTILAKKYIFNDLDELTSTHDVVSVQSRYSRNCRKHRHGLSSSSCDCSH